MGVFLPRQTEMVVTSKYWQNVWLRNGGMGRGGEWLLRMVGGRRGEEQKDDFFFPLHFVYCKMSEVK